MSNLIVFLTTPCTVIVLNAAAILLNTVRRHKMRKLDDRKVEAIQSYQRGDLDPWDPRYLEQAKKRKRHGYAFDKNRHEDPWEVG